jgi:hypothetical protein
MLVIEDMDADGAPLFWGGRRGSVKSHPRRCRPCLGCGALNPRNRPPPPPPILPRPAHLTPTARFSANYFVVDPQFSLKFYVAAPLVSADGHRLVRGGAGPEGRRGEGETDLWQCRVFWRRRGRGPCLLA